ncbi:hypothetical protein LIER_14985 [Lithospermum erythrorhizon]|uniref:Macro domain-containing protein n=1 Tax=Lithospermum erythrorhizon TaxID=34254 RepID=A0AAV3Q3E2_LITER
MIPRPLLKPTRLLQTLQIHTKYNSRSTRYTTLIPPPRTFTTLFPRPEITGVATSCGGCIFGGARVSTMSSGDEAEFQLTSSTTLKIKLGDITKWSIDGSSDAIVNPANERMLGGGGADGAIHRAAGPELREACYKVPEVRPGVRCPIGEARITKGFKLPASHVIHTVGPIYDSDRNPEASLRNSYKNSLEIAMANNIKYIAFPAISCGVFGYPFDEAAKVALSAVKEYTNDLKEVHFVLFSDDIYEVWVETASELLQK